MLFLCVWEVNVILQNIWKLKDTTYQYLLQEIYITDIKFFDEKKYFNM